MNYHEFCQYRTLQLDSDPDLLDLGETNLYRALSGLSVHPVGEGVTTKVHRCHLAQDWVRYFGLPDDHCPRAFVTAGVRDSLATLFGYYRDKGYSAWLPQDNYPVFHQLATDAKFSFESFSTIGGCKWPFGGGEILLVTNPLKPEGRYLSDGDVASLRAWLKADPRRRLLLDTVYTLGNSFHESSVRLFKTGQTVVLHSLTKGWMHPKLFGICLVPSQDCHELSKVFRAHSPSQRQLRMAKILLNDHMELPTRVSAALDVARATLLARVPKHVRNSARVDPSVPSYFIPVSLGTRELIERYRILGIPASVFGSDLRDVSILSSLLFAGPERDPVNR